MSNVLMALTVFSGLFVIFIVSVFLGRMLGRWKIFHDDAHKLEIVTVAEGAVFGLLGLLIAFTFTGAYDRFQMREYRIIEEANAIDTAYMRLQLLEPGSRALVKKDFVNYINARLQFLSSANEFDSDILKKKQAILQQSQSSLWDDAINATRITNVQSATLLVVTAINNMFEIANLRSDITKVHQPMVVLFLLIGLSVVSAFLAGYATARKKIQHSVHVFSFVLIMAVTIYVIIDLELPRMGLISVQHFEQILMHVGDKITQDAMQ